MLEQHFRGARAASQWRASGAHSGTCWASSTKVLGGLDKRLDGLGQIWDCFGESAWVSSANFDRFRGTRSAKFGTAAAKLEAASINFEATSNNFGVWTLVPSGARATMPGGRAPHSFDIASFVQLNKRRPNSHRVHILENKTINQHLLHRAADAHLIEKDGRCASARDLCMQTHSACKEKR